MSNIGSRVTRLEKAVPPEDRQVRLVHSEEECREVRGRGFRGIVIIAGLPARMPGSGWPEPEPR